jgi:Superinfection immunity protein
MIGLHLMLLSVCFVIIYFLPTVIAVKTKRKNKLGIAILNLFFGWTFLGWIGALIWSVLEDK